MSSENYAYLFIFFGILIAIGGYISFPYVENFIDSFQPQSKATYEDSDISFTYNDEKILIYKGNTTKSLNGFEGKHPPTYTQNEIVRGSSSGYYGASEEILYFYIYKHPSNLTIEDYKKINYTDNKIENEKNISINGQSANEITVTGKSIENEHKIIFFKKNDEIYELMFIYPAGSVVFDRTMNQIIDSFQIKSK